MIIYFVKPPERSAEEWVQTLQTWLAEAQADLAAGKTTTQAGAGDTNATETIQVPVKERIEELLKALNYYDPTNYPSSLVRRVTRTRIQVYSQYPSGV